jgi:hypothetical protein
MAKQQTIAELAQVLVRQLYESSDAGARQVRVVPKGPAASAALEFALDNDWVEVEGEQDVRLTATGCRMVKKLKPPRNQSTRRLR